MNSFLRLFFDGASGTTLGTRFRALKVTDFLRRVSPIIMQAVAVALWGGDDLGWFHIIEAVDIDGIEPSPEGRHFKITLRKTSYPAPLTKEHALVMLLCGRRIVLKR